MDSEPMLFYDYNQHKSDVEKAKWTGFIWGAGLVSVIVFMLLFALPIFIK